MKARIAVSGPLSQVSSVVFQGTCTWKKRKGAEIFKTSLGSEKIGIGASLKLSGFRATHTQGPPNLLTGI